MTLNGYSSTGLKRNGCGMDSYHTFSLMTVFNITDANNKNFGCLLIRNPWGGSSNYNTSFNYESSFWTNSLVAQVPFGLDPRTSINDGIIVVPIELLSTCFASF